MKIKQTLLTIICVIASLIISFTMIFSIENTNHFGIVYADEIIHAVRYGDINADGVVDVGDGVVIKRYIGTFLENYDLTGVHIYPFTQSASMNTEQFNNSMDFVRSCANNATVHDGLFTRATNDNAIMEYLNNNNLMD